MSIIGRKVGRSIKSLCVLGAPCAWPKLAACGLINLKSSSEISPRLRKVDK